MRQKKAVPKWCATHPQSHGVGRRQQFAENRVFLGCPGVNIQKDEENLGFPIRKIGYEGFSE